MIDPSWCDLFFPSSAVPPVVEKATTSTTSTRAGVTAVRLDGGCILYRVAAWERPGRSRRRRRPR